jgi:hypothetical protein
MVSPDNLIPPDSELGLLLAQWSEDGDTRTWNIANLTNELIEELEGEAITKADIYRAVATRCKGREPNTIRRWADIARDFDQDTQLRYAQLLSFNHFKTARRLYQEERTPYLNYALEWCVEGNDDKLSAGRFHTVGQMLEHFLPPESFEDQLRRHWNKQKERLYDLILIHDNDVERARLLQAYTEFEYVLGLDRKEQV